MSELHATMIFMKRLLRDIARLLGPVAGVAAFLLVMGLLVATDGAWVITAAGAILAVSIAAIPFYFAQELLDARKSRRRVRAEWRAARAERRAPVLPAYYCRPEWLPQARGAASDPSR